MSITDVAGTIVYGLANEAGATVNLNNEGPEHTGYMVGGYAAERTFAYNNGNKAMAAEVVKYIIDRVSDLEADPDLYIGAWLEGGTVYLDLSKHWADSHSDAALADARERGQLAYWDLEFKKSVWVDHHIAVEPVGNLPIHSGPAYTPEYEEGYTEYKLDSV